MSEPRPAQLELFGLHAVARTPVELHAALVRRCPHALRLTLTQNAVSMVSVRFATDAVHLRLNRAFLVAPDPVVEALGDYLRSRVRSAWQIVGAYADTIAPEALVRRPPRLATQGAVYDLLAMRDRVNQRFFNGRLDCLIGWGRLHLRRRRRTRSRTIRFGSYVRAQNLVRINPILDDPRVPAEFLEYIVFHEMLHAVVPSETNGGRQSHHPSVFRELERQYPERGKMRDLSANLVKLLAVPAIRPFR